MNDIIPFDFKGSQVRTQPENNVVWFNGQDVAKALGYKDHKKALKTHCGENGVAKRPLIDSMGRQQEAVFITESNVYRLAAHSRLPAARVFEAWVFEEVLPAIRKHGGYVRNDITPEQAKFFISTIENYAFKSEMDNIRINALESIVEAIAPRGRYGDISRATNLPKIYKQSAAWKSNSRAKRQKPGGAIQGLLDFCKHTIDELEAREARP